jgi:hypothetical protein
LPLRHARPQGRSSPGATESSIACARVTSCRAESGIEEALATPFPQTGDRLWRVGRLPEKGSVVRRWKAPRVRLSTLTFAGRRTKRPFPGAPAAAGPGTHGGARASTCEVSRGRRAHRVSGEAVVSGRRSSRLATWGARVDRVGAKLLPRAIAVGEVAMWPASPRHARPLTRGTSAGQLAQARPAIRSPRRARKGTASGRKAAPAGDCGCGAAELGHSWSCSWIVSIAEVDRRCPASIPHA